MYTGWESEVLELIYSGEKEGPLRMSGASSAYGGARAAHVVPVP